ncbi:MAG: UDP-N-acetylmuramoyl-L-alanine--D-glutamate ligase [Rudaea sp.]
MRLSELAGKRVAIWGFGREGRATLRVLRQRFAHQHVTLFCSEAEAATVELLAPSAPTASGQRAGQRGRRENLHDDSDSDALARHATRSSIAGNAGEGLYPGLDIVTSPPDLNALAQFDIVIKSPGISPYKSPLPEAAQAGVQFTSASALWFAENPDARTICVTGTKGKSTVTALIAHVLRESGKCVAMAGNIGMPLLDLVNPPRAPDWWVIELSSFQTRDFDGAPTIAVITNLYEEHLDWHVTRENYIADKLAIGKHAKSLIVADQAQMLELTCLHPDRHVLGTQAGWHVAGDWICRGEERVLRVADVPLSGLHNAQNVSAALSAIEVAGLDAALLARHVASFRALPHRLQSLGVRGEREYVNDSIATTPYATVEALSAFAARDVVVLVGGFDRGVDWQVFIDHVRRHPPRAVVASGANGARIAAQLARIEAPGFVLENVATLSDAVERARALVPAGGVVLLSPGAPSFDAFGDYTQRGREFARLAGFENALAQIEGVGVA